ncbi:hypothetical protein [Terricaulis sp.]|uniref:hypothetical protein n=1 Tax=Terricaulis sp. TaxID=2768686 RepID=UPI002AC60800|nr:hypothetical protein [Terricaulis sp.]MDZ4689687.1 hypothetical protein [Terricaulis sp.]
MTLSSVGAEAPEHTYRPAYAETVWRIANPIMTALIGLISAGWSGALWGLSAGVAFVATPLVWPHAAKLVRRVRAWGGEHLPEIGARLLAYLPTPLVRLLERSLWGRS